MSRLTFHALCVSAMLLCLTSCDFDDEVDDSYVVRRTVMVYMAAENSLNTFAQSDIREMVKAAKEIPADSRLLIFIDDRRMTRILEITRERGDTATIYAYPSNECAAEAETLGDAIDRMYALAPAEQYGLVIWSHASGWLPAVKAQHTRSIFEDSNSAKGGKCTMEISELADVLKNYPKWQFLFIDACLMQCVEVDYALRGVADYIIASPAEIPAHGATYDRMMPVLFAKTFDPVALARTYYETESDYLVSNNYEKGGGVVVSVVKCAEMDNLAKATKRLVGTDPMSADDVQKYWLYVVGTKKESTDFPDFCDIKGVMGHFAHKPEYAAWLEQFNKTVVYVAATPYWDSVCKNFEYWQSTKAYGYRGVIRDMSMVGGMSIFVPQDKYVVGAKAWNEDIKKTEWGRMLFAE